MLDTLFHDHSIPAQIFDVTVDAIADEHGSTDSALAGRLNNLFDLASIECSLFGEDFTVVANFTSGSIQNLSQNGQPISVELLHCSIV